MVCIYFCLKIMVNSKEPSKYYLSRFSHIIQKGNNILRDLLLNHYCTFQLQKNTNLIKVSRLLQLNINLLTRYSLYIHIYSPALKIQSFPINLFSTLSFSSPPPPAPASATWSTWGTWSTWCIWNTWSTWIIWSTNNWMRLEVKFARSSKVQVMFSCY